MTARFPPPRKEGLLTLAPELARIVEALARVAEERDYRAGILKFPEEDDPRRHLRSL